MVEVHIFGTSQESSLQLDLGGCEVSVANLLARLDIDPSEVGIVTVDRRRSDLGEIVPADSRVCVFPPMFGG